MRIFQINAYFSAGGSARIVNGIYCSLLTDGNDCKIVASRSPIVHHESSYRIGSFVSMCMKALMVRLFDNEGFLSQTSTKKVLKLLREYKPDVIHIHNLHGYYINIKLLFDFLKQEGIPVVWTLHDCWSFTGHCINFDAAKCDKWSSAKGCDNACSMVKEYPNCWLNNHTERNFNRKKEIFTGVPNLTIVTPSEWLKRRVEKSFLKDYPIKVIPNGIDTTLFHPVENDIKRKYGIEGKTLLLGVAMPWLRRKGLYDFIELAKRLDDNYVIMLVGVKNCQKSLLPKNIISVPYITDSHELAKYYSAADVVLNLSVEETFGLVSIESLACGTPVILYNATACPETIDSTCGIVIEKSARIDALVDVVTSGKWRKISQEACLAHAEQFSATKRFPEYLNLYRSIISEGQK